MKKFLFSFILIFGSTAVAQSIQLSASAIVPSVTDSVGGAVNVVMTDADCNIVSASGCSVAAKGPFVKTLNITGTLTAQRNLTVVGSPGREYVINNGTSQSLIVGAGGSTVLVPAGAMNMPINSGDGINYYLPPGQAISAALIDGSSLVSAVTSCGANHGTIQVSQALTPSTMTVPANCALVFLGGGSLNPPSGQTVTILGDIQADPNAQIFGGAGSIAGLRTVRPEWFGVRTLKRAISSCSSSGCNVLLQTTPGAHYKSDYDEVSSFMTLPNVRIIGNGQPMEDVASAPTKLVGGTIIDCTFAVGTGAHNFVFQDAGVDGGSANVTAGTCPEADGLGVNAAASGTPLHNPLVRNATFLGLNNTSAYHALKFETVDGGLMDNVRVLYSTHGPVIKGTNSTMRHVYSAGHRSECAIFKANVGEPSNDDTADDINCGVIAVQDTSGFSVHAQGMDMNRITLSNIHCNGTTTCLTVYGESTYSVNGLTVTNMTGLGPAAQGIYSTGVFLEGNMAAVRIANSTFDHYDRAAFSYTGNVPVDLQFDGVVARNAYFNPFTLAGATTKLYNTHIFQPTGWAACGIEAVAAGVVTYYNTDMVASSGGFTCNDGSTGASVNAGNPRGNLNNAWPSTQGHSQRRDH